MPSFLLFKKNVQYLSSPPCLKVSKEASDPRSPFSTQELSTGASSISCSFCTKCHHCATQQCRQRPAKLQVLISQ